MEDKFLKRLQKPIVLSGMGISRLTYDEDWEQEEAPRRGLRNPWQHDPTRPFKGDDGEWHYKEKQPGEIKAWKEERDSYIRLRKEYICDRIFHDYGYEAFLNECDFQGVEYYKKTFFPCESQEDSQCNMFCPIFNDCAERR